MEMSNALQKNLMQLFPNKIIYSAELCKNISVHLDTCADSIWAQKLQHPFLEQNYLIFSLRQKKRRYRKKIELPVEGCSRPAIHGLLLQQQSIGNSCVFPIVEARLRFLPATWKSLIRNFCAAAVFGTLLRNAKKKERLS